ncbi:MAG: cache domain-containing protein [Alphaproteobacteria bacterium]|nr:cache domain-containing protein [Alphaproteobacteria bacterium]
MHLKLKSLALATGVVLLIGMQPAVFATPATAGESELSSLIAKKAAILESLHKKAKKALVNSAQDKVFPNYFHAAHGHRHEAKAKIEQVTLAVQSNFHVEEMCLIDPSGPEITRIVGSVIAPDEELSPDESGAIFFAPGFAKAPRRVHLSPPYMSPDAHKWVLAYTTPVVVDDEKKAILHYEHGLDVFQNALKGGAYILAVSEDGYVISDSRKSLNIILNNDNSEELAGYFQTLEQSEGAGLS